jgi:flavoprotein
MWISIFESKEKDECALVTRLPEGPPAAVRLTVPWTVGAKSSQECYDDVASRVAAVVALVAAVDAEHANRVAALDALENLLDPKRVTTN